MRIVFDTRNSSEARLRRKLEIREVSMQYELATLNKKIEKLVAIQDQRDEDIKAIEMSNSRIDAMDSAIKLGNDKLEKLIKSL